MLSIDMYSFHCSSISVGVKHCVWPDFVLAVQLYFTVV